MSRPERTSSLAALSRSTVTTETVAPQIEFLLPWDDPEIDRGSGLALFDVFASAEKTLLAFPGWHFHVPAVGSTPASSCGSLVRRHFLVLDQCFRLESRDAVAPMITDGTRLSTPI